MKFRYSPVALAVFAALGSAGLSPVAAQQAQPQAKSLERVTITGSNISGSMQNPSRRSRLSPASRSSAQASRRSRSPPQCPVQHGRKLQRELLQQLRTGRRRHLPARLGQKSTLVLINGRRTRIRLRAEPAGYLRRPELDSVFRGRAHRNAERRRLGHYGSDAIAGVVNVILRKDYKGIEVGGTAGTSEGANDYRVDLAGGMGDLAKDKYNVFGVFDYYKRDFLAMSDTEFGKSRDKRGEEGGRNSQSLTGGGTWRQLTAAGALTNNHRAISECRGHRDDLGPQAVEPGLDRCQQRASTSRATRSAPRIQQRNSPRCRRPNAWASSAAARSTSRRRCRPSAEAGFARRDLPDVPVRLLRRHDGLNRPGRPASVHLQHQFRPWRVRQPVQHRARYVGVLDDIGTRNLEITSDTARFLAGLK